MDLENGSLVNTLQLDQLETTSTGHRIHALATHYHCDDDLKYNIFLVVNDFLYLPAK